MRHWAGNLDETIEKTADLGMRYLLPFVTLSPQVGFAGTEAVPGRRLWEHAPRRASLDALANESPSDSSDIRVVLDRRLAAGQIDSDTHAELARDADFIAAALAAGEDPFADGRLARRPGPWPASDGQGSSRLADWIRRFRLVASVAIAALLALTMVGAVDPF
ncbi:hypothetical protein [Amorphus sp. MBR-141]